MRHRRFDWHERIKAAEREYWSARIAIDRLSAEAAHDSTILGKGPSPRDLKSADENLEETYSALPAANSDELSPINALLDRLESLGFGRAIRRVNRNIASTNPAVSDASRARSR